MADNEEVPGQLELPLDWPAPGAKPVDPRAEIERVRRENQTLYRQLAASGVMPDPMGVLMLRLNVLLDTVLDSRARQEFELAFELAMSEVLAECDRKRNTAQLLAPMTPPGRPSGLIRP